MKIKEEEYSQKELLENIYDRYILNLKFKINGEICISEKFGIVIRNINEIENHTLATPLVRVIKNILMLTENLNDFIEPEKVKTIHEKYVKELTEFDDNTIIKMDIDGYDKYLEIKNIIQIITENISDYISEKDKTLVAENIVGKYLEQFIILHVKKSYEIVQFIKNNSRFDEEQIELYGLVNEFIYKYIELWNAINFKQIEYLGIKISDFNNKLDNLLDHRHNENSALSKEFINILKNIWCVDIIDEKIMYYITNRFYENVLDENRILLYFSLVELLISHKPKNSKDSIISQLTNNITQCMNEMKKIDCDNEELNITTKEIKLLYEYRSILVHGNFNKEKEILKKLEKIDFFKKYKKILNVEDDELKEMFLVSIIRIRTLNIFSTIYKMCIIDDKYVKSIKNKTIKNSLIQYIKNKLKR